MEAIIIYFNDGYKSEVTNPKMINDFKEVYDKSKKSINKLIFKLLKIEYLEFSKFNENVGKFIIYDMISYKDNKFHTLMKKENGDPIWVKI